MASPNHNPLPIDEGDMLALVEGVALPANRVARVREALAADPRLADLARLMKADREGLAALGEVTAPADLLDRVEMQLEREALVGLANSEAKVGTDQLRISSVIPVRPSIWNARWARPLAAAAALAIMAGGTLMMWSANHNKPIIPRPQPVGDDIAHGPVKPPIVVEKPVGPGPEIATKDHPNTDLPVVETDPTPPAVAVVQPVAEITIDRALAAALDGKLVLRVGDKNPAGTAIRVRNTALRGASITELSADPYQQVAAAFRESEQTAWAAAHPKHPTPAPGPTETPAVAGPDAPVARHIDPPPAPEPVYDGPAIILHEKGFIANVAMDSASLEALKKALSGDQPATWQIVNHPLKLDAPSDIESLLWWNAPSATWGPRLRVPVVIQAK